MDLFINGLEKNQVITSYNFARKCDVVFSENVTTKQFESLTNKNLYKINQSGNQILYINTNFQIKENDIIFCNTYLVLELFSMLDKVTNLSNIKLLTNQTDHEITKKLYSQKSSCISEWYSINVSHKSEDLIPIPLGLSNDYSQKNLNIEHYKKLKPKKNKKNKIYSNFQVNTNFKYRTRVLRGILNDSSYFLDQPMLKLNSYLNNLSSFKYALAPEGNGLDTHRVWEALYADCIPIVRNLQTFNTLDGLNAIRLESLVNIDIRKINSYEVSSDSQLEKLTIGWWIAKMKNKKINSNDIYFFNQSNEESKSIKLRYLRNIKKENRYKKIKTIQRKILKKFL